MWTSEAISRREAQTAFFTSLLMNARFVILNAVKNPVRASWPDARAKVQMDSSLRSE